MQKSRQHTTNNANTNAFTDAEQTKLAGIEALADVTDAANVAAAGAVMNTGDETIAGVKTFSSTISGSIDGNAATVTDGVYTTSSVTALSDVTDAGSGAIITGAERTKLDGIEAGATGDMTDAEIKTAYENNANTNAFTDAEQTKLAGIEALADVTDAANVAAAGAVMNTGDETIAGVKTFSSTISGSIDGNAATVTDGVYTTSSVTALSDVTDAGSGAIITGAERTKLDGIEAGATGDMTDAEIKTAYENNANTNAFTDAEQTKLTGIETGATADQTDAEIKTAYENNANTNAFTDAEQTKLAGIETGATADQTDAEIKTAYENNANTNAFTDAEQTKLAGIEALADVTDAANVAAAGAVMNTGDETIAGVKTFSSTISGSIDGNAATATALATARNFSASGDATAVWYHSMALAMLTWR